MNSGKYVFSQIVDFLKMTSFKKFVKRYKGDYRVRELTCHNQLLHLLFGQLSPCESLRDTDLALLALDSTTISVSLKLCNWALGKYSRGDVKMHTLLDLRGGIPVQIHVSDGCWHDSNMLDKLVVEPGAIYAADKAYVDLVALRRIHLSSAFFVVRPKSNMKFVFKDELIDKGQASNIVGDYRFHNQQL